MSEDDSLTGKTKSLLLRHAEPEQNIGRLINDILKWYVLKSNICVLTQISLKFIREGPAGNLGSIYTGNTMAPNKHQAIT